MKQKKGKKPVDDLKLHPVVVIPPDIEMPIPYSPVPKSPLSEIHKSWLVSESELAFGSVLGSGSYGEVRRGKWRGTDVAIKTYFAQTDKANILDFESEVQMLSTLRHPNILQFLGLVTQPKMSIVTELMPRGSLFQILHKSPDLEIDPRRRLKMALDIARGMNQLHSLDPPIVHRDLKSPNLLVALDWTVKVADVSLSPRLFV